MNAALQAAETACAAGRCEEAITALEQATPHRPGDRRLYYWLGVCYGGSCRAHSQVHPAMAGAYLQQALRLAPVRDAARAAVLDQLANASLHNQAFAAAIEFESEAAGIYQELGLDEDWGRVQFNLGNSCCDLAETAGGNCWREAIGHYQECLKVRTREADPERYAAALENLGTAYRRLPAPDAGEGIRQAILCYRRAMAVYTRSHYPEKNAALENNLGNAFLALTEIEDSAAPRHTRRALRHFERALGLEPDPSSRAFGIAQYNRAQAWFRLARYGAGDFGRGAACLKAAVAAFEACAEERYLQLVRRQLEDLKPPASLAPASLPRAGS